MSNHESLDVTRIDQAYDQAMAEVRHASHPPLVQLGCHHGVRLLRQRIGGQFVRNQAHHVTVDQLKTVGAELHGEVERREAPSPELTSSSVRDHVDYWQGFERGVACYQAQLQTVITPSLAARRPRP